jgi:hypothetical protein
VPIKNQGIAAFSVSPGGAIALTDSDTAGLNDPAGVVWTGAYFVVADDLGGLRSYSLDGGGNITFVNSAACNGYPRKIHWDGNFLFVVADDNGSAYAGLYVYSIDGAGAMIEIDYHNIGGFFGNNYLDCYSDGTWVYALQDNLLLIYEVDGAGNLTYKVSWNVGGETTYRLWKQGDFIIVGTLYGGMYSYSWDGVGTPEEKDHEPNPPLQWPGKMRGDSTFLYVPSRSAFHGFKTYEVV